MATLAPRDAARSLIARASDRPMRPGLVESAIAPLSRNASASSTEVQLRSTSTGSGEAACRALNSASGSKGHGSSATIAPASAIART